MSAPDSAVGVVDRGTVTITIELPLETGELVEKALDRARDHSALQTPELADEGGFRIERDYQNRWFFKRPDGHAVPSCGYHAQDMIDDELGNDLSDSIGNTIRKLSKVIKNPSAEVLLTAAKTCPVNSPPP